MNAKLWARNQEEDKEIFIGEFQYLEPQLYLQVDEFQRPRHNKWWMLKEKDKIYLQPFEEYSRNKYNDCGQCGLEDFWEECGDIVFDLDNELVVKTDWFF